MNICKEYSVVCHLATDLGYCASTACTRYLEIDVVPKVNKNLVEVVRCKECKHNYNTAINHGKMNPRCDFMDVKLKPDDFCSYGEREGE